MVKSKKMKSARYLIILIALVVLYGCSTVRLQSDQETEKFIEVHMINVGYGEAIVIKSPENRSILWDGGYPEMGELVLQYLERIGVSDLDLVVNSHPHPDHIGGLPFILSNMQTSQVWGSHPLEFEDIPDEFREVVAERKITYNTVREGYVWHWNPEIKLEILNPEEIVPDMNDSSLVCKITYHKCSILLTADVGPRVQENLVTKYNSTLQSCLSNVSHHGGRSYLPFFDIVNPSFYMLSVGPNPWGNPKSSTIEHIQQLNTNLLRTDIQGTLVFQCHANGEVRYITY